MTTERQTPPIGRQLTRQRLKEDLARLRTTSNKGWHSGGKVGRLHPSYLAVYLHRWSHFHFVNGRRWLSRLYWHLNLILTGADISPMCDLGGGLVLVFPMGTMIFGKAGRNLTVMGHCGLGGGMDSADIGAGPGLPVLGDDIHLHYHTIVLGPVHVGDRARMGPGVLVVRNVAADAVLLPARPRFRVATEAVEA